MLKVKIFSLFLFVVTAFATDFSISDPMPVLMGQISQPFPEKSTANNLSNTTTRWTQINMVFPEATIYILPVPIDNKTRMVSSLSCYKYDRINNVLAQPMNIYDCSSAECGEMNYDGGGHGVNQTDCVLHDSIGTGWLMTPQTETQFMRDKAGSWYMVNVCCGHGC